MKNGVKTKRAARVWPKAAAMLVAGMAMAAAVAEGNDNFADARVISGASGSAAFDNTGYTCEDGEPVHSDEGYSGGASAWAAWTAPSTGDWTFRLSGDGSLGDSDLDTQLAIYTGSSVGALTLVAANDDTVRGGYSSELSFRATAGVKYMIAMDAYNGAGGPVTLVWEEGVAAYIQFAGYQADSSGYKAFAPVSGGTVSMRAVSSTTWKVVSYPSWVTPKTMSGSNGSTLSFTVAANATGAVRTGDFMVQVGTTLQTKISVMQNAIDFVTSFAAAEAAAKAANKPILLVYGRENCWNTRTTLYTTLPSATVKPTVGRYVVWYCNCDRQFEEADDYLYDISGTWTLPGLCIIKPSNISVCADRITGYHDADELLAFLRGGLGDVSCSVTFDANGGSVSSASRTVDAGAAVGTLPTPTWGGHTFNGWYTAKAGGTKISASTTVNADVTYYAQWTVKQYKLAYSANGGSVSPAYKMVNYCATYGTLPTPTWGGHTFNGWFTARTGGTKVSSSTKCVGNATIYAQWTVKQYKLTYNANGGSVSPATKMVNYCATYGTLPTPTWGGHTFNGWFTARTGGTKVTSSTKCVGNATIYAQWAVKQYKVTFDANGGSVSPAYRMMDYCATYGTLPTPTWSGHTFGGWFTAASGGTQVTASTKCVGNATVYARWSTGGAGPATGGHAKWTLLSDGSWKSGTIADGQETWLETTVSGPGSLSFEWNTSSEANYDKLTFSYKKEGDSAFTDVTDISGERDFTSYGTGAFGSGKYVFRWTYKKDVSQSAGSDCAWVRNIAWKMKEYKISYNANGGSVSPAYKMVEYCKTYGTLPTPTWSGRTFNGWYTAASGGTKVTSSTKCVGNATIYAQWK